MPLDMATWKSSALYILFLLKGLEAVRITFYGSNGNATSYDLMGNCFGKEFQTYGTGQTDFYTNDAQNKSVGAWTVTADIPTCEEDFRWKWSTMNGTYEKSQNGNRVIPNSILSQQFAVVYSRLGNQSDNNVYFSDNIYLQENLLNVVFIRNETDLDPNSRYTVCGRCSDAKSPDIDQLSSKWICHSPPEKPIDGWVVVKMHLISGCQFEWKWKRLCDSCKPSDYFKANSSYLRVDPICTESTAYLKVDGLQQDGCIFEKDLPQKLATSSTSTTYPSTLREDTSGLATINRTDTKIPSLIAGTTTSTSNTRQTITFSNVSASLSSSVTTSQNPRTYYSSRKEILTSDGKNKSQTTSYIVRTASRRVTASTHTVSTSSHIVSTASHTMSIPSHTATTFSHTLSTSSYTVNTASYAANTTQETIVSSKSWPAKSSQGRHAMETLPDKLETSTVTKATTSVPNGEGTTSKLQLLTKSEQMIVIIGSILLVVVTIIGIIIVLVRRRRTMNIKQDAIISDRFVVGRGSIAYTESTDNPGASVLMKENPLYASSDEPLDMITVEPSQGSDPIYSLSEPFPESPPLPPPPIASETGSSGSPMVIGDEIMLDNPLYIKSEKF